jgi:hypothetical protein
MENKESRFIKTTPEVVGEGTYNGSEWWFDTARPINEPPGYIAVECYKDKNPNDFIKCDGMRLLFTDQAEYYFVCKDCYNIYSRMQWSGGTRSGVGWRERAENALQKHEHTKGWCEFCDPVFGNDGWCI